MARPRETNRVAVGQNIAVLFCTGGNGRTFGVTVDKDDLPRVMDAGKWGVKVHPSSKRLYAQKNIDGKKVTLHRFLVPGVPELDHVNGRGLDNRKANLRPATREQNVMNRRPRGQFKGVASRPTTSGRYVAQISHGGERVHIGVFDTREQAARAYDAKAKEFFGEFAYLNFPEAK